MYSKEVFHPARQAKGDIRFGLHVLALYHLHHQKTDRSVLPFCRPYLVSGESGFALKGHYRLPLTSTLQMLSPLCISTENGISVVKLVFAVISMVAAESCSPISGRNQCTETPSCSVVPASVLRTCSPFKTASQAHEWM